MIKCVIAVSFLFFSVTVLAQDFRPGFIIKLNGDSIPGFIDNRSDKSKTLICHFKPSKKSRVVKYKPTEIKSFGFIDDKYYSSAILSIKGKKKSVFIEVLVKGKASLYRYLDVFYFEKDSMVFLPKSESQIVSVKDVTYSRPTTKYIGLLNIFLADCNLDPARRFSRNTKNKLVKFFFR